MPASPPQGQGQEEGKLRGIGVSCYIEACGIAPSKAVGSLGAGVGLWESAEIRVNPVGTIEVLTGSHSHGQGHETTFAQLIAERLGVPISQVPIVHGDTDKVQFGMGTYGSRSLAVGGTAIVKAMEKVEAKAKKIAAHQLEASEDDIVIENGEFKVTGTDKALALPMVALAAYTAHNLPDGMEPGLKETAFYDPTNFTFPAGSYICELEVDPGTGKTSVRQLRRGRRFRPADQPDDRRRPGPWRPRPGHRPGPAGKHRLRRQRPARHRELHGLRHAAGQRPALVQPSHTTTLCPGTRSASRAAARRRDRRRGGRHQRDHRRHRQQQTRDAGLSRPRLARDPRCLTGDNESCTRPGITGPPALTKRRRCLPRAPTPKYLAGGHTLLPVMKQRLASPSDVIDLARIKDLVGIGIPPATPSPSRRQRPTSRFWSSADVKKAIPALVRLTTVLGDPAVRYRGTIGGSIANNDPAADYPAAALALGATVKTNKRSIAADQFFQGLFSTALEDGEIITPDFVPDPRQGGLFENAPPGLALRADRRVRGEDQGGRCARRRHRRLAERRDAGAGDRGGAEGQLVAGRALQRQDRRRPDLLADIHGSAAYRANLIKVMAQRAVADAG